MPRRWLSVKRKGEITDPSLVGNDADDDFEFAFRAECGLGDKKDECVELRPTTSGEDRHTSKRIPDLSLLIERPRSSDSVLQKTPYSARFRDSQIGLALGSPCHPPEVFTIVEATMNPEQQNHAFSSYGPLPATQNGRSKKWKLGGLFRTKSITNRENFYSLKTTSPESKKLGLPLHSTRTPWRNPKSPMPSRDEFETPPPMPISKDLSTLSGDNTKVLQRIDQVTTPTLEVSIPDSPLERYSVMFKGVNGVQQSRLLVRRSKGLNQLVIAKQSKEQLQVPSIVRRATSPTGSSPRLTTQSSTSGINSSKYSLFPATPTLSITQAVRDSPGSMRNRSLTAPSLSCSPMVPRKDLSSRQPQNKAPTPSDQQLLGSAKPEPQRTASQDSQGSHASEIFFDIKSFRDSTGQEEHQFVRPPSAAVQLARSKSNARKLQQKQQNNPEVDNASADKRKEKTASVEIDETIALVESLTSQSTEINSAASTIRDCEPVKPNLQCLPKTQYKAAGTSSGQNRRSQSSKSRIDTLNIDVPSPVLETTEELTPNTCQQNVLTQQVEPVANTITAAYGMNQDSTVVPASLPRPAPPVKEHKHIPLSKYAPKSTTTELINQVGLRPVRTGRSHTATSHPWQDRTSSLQRPQPPARSATVPTPPAAPRVSRVPKSRYSTSQPIIAGPDTIEKTMPTMVAYVKPSAEVSIARTVSLARKPSAAAKVTVTSLTRAPSTKASEQGLNKRVAQISDRPQDADGKLDIGRVDSLSKKHERIKESVQENKREVNLGTPVVQEVHSRHKPGRSMDVVLETAGDIDVVVPPVPSNAPPPVPVPSPSMFQTRMDGDMVACS